MEDPPNFNLATKPTKTPPAPPPGPTPASGGGVAPPLSTLPRKKRKVTASDNLNSHDSKYSQIRTLLKVLRPVFIKILKTPGYRNSTHALEICAGMKTMMKLCKQLRAETCMVGKNKRPLEGTSAAGESVDNQSNKRQKEDTTQETSQGTSIIGGSPIGWNFIWFMNTEKKATSTA